MFSHVCFEVCILSLIEKQGTCVLRPTYFFDTTKGNQKIKESVWFRRFIAVKGENNESVARAHLQAPADDFN